MNFILYKCVTCLRMFELYIMKSASDSKCRKGINWPLRPTGPYGPCISEPEEYYCHQMIFDRFSYVQVVKRFQREESYFAYSLYDIDHSTALVIFHWANINGYFGISFDERKSSWFSHLTRGVLWAHFVVLWSTETDFNRWFESHFQKCD